MAVSPNELHLYKFCPHCGHVLTNKTVDQEQVKACTHCDFIFWNKSKPVVSIILHKDGHVLMIQRANEPFKEYWVLPGGFISSNETAEEAIVRETLEETGNIVKPEKIIGTYLIDNDPRGLHLDIIFTGRIDEQVKLTEDNTHWKYFSPLDLPIRIAYKHREAIIDWSKQND
jgi:8-oxo-dGTP diphosphatase